MEIRLLDNVTAVLEFTNEMQRSETEKEIRLKDFRLSNVAIRLQVNEYQIDARLDIT